VRKLYLFDDGIGTPVSSSKKESFRDKFRKIEGHALDM
jgi:hypothetical protein